MVKKMPQTTDSDRELLGELGIDLTAPAPVQYSPREERIIAGFEEIERFVSAQGRLPQHGDDRDIFERLYAVRLDRLRRLEDCRTLLEPLDSRGLLTATPDLEVPPALDDQALLAELGLDGAAVDDVTQLTHVRSRQDIKAAEEIAQRTPCEDFNQFKPLFQQVKQALKTGARHTLKYQDNAAIQAGNLFILDGQMVLVAAMGEFFISDYGRPNAELRVIYDNGTESNLLLRSLQRALNRDRTSRRITELVSNFGPLFAPQNLTPTDRHTGQVYVLRSQSDHPFIAAHRTLIHKIGMTSGDVNQRIIHAAKDPTYLLAAVEIVTTFQLANINPKKLEALLHRFFEAARLDLELMDRFGLPVQPQEWFFVPLGAIEAAIAHIQAGTLDQVHYDLETASIIAR
ncbi:GIY-YIG nuclease family protein [Spirulina subsalsa]|uniref:GIY-YIG nuclease family protein n=1 Tax=Spirulina TaxID=1154 RepID=UPI002330D95F|nr:GIY-YIG nuclease family protein [Spirulina subsalsa]